jgi:hypothetical protein
MGKGGREGEKKEHIEGTKGKGREEGRKGRGKKESDLRWI